MVSENMAVGSPNLHLPVSVLQELMSNEKGRSMAKNKANFIVKNEVVGAKMTWQEGVLDFIYFMI